MLMGSFGHRLVGKVNFEDKANELSAYVNFGAYTFKKQDYVWGEIKKAG